MRALYRLARPIKWCVAQRATGRLPSCRGEHPMAAQMKCAQTDTDHAAHRNGSSARARKGPVMRRAPHTAPCTGTMRDSNATKTASQNLTVLSCWRLATRTSTSQPALAGPGAHAPSAPAGTSPGERLRPASCHPAAATEGPTAEPPCPPHGRPTPPPLPSSPTHRPCRARAALRPRGRARARQRAAPRCRAYTMGLCAPPGSPNRGRLTAAGAASLVWIRRGAAACLCTAG